MIWMRQNRQSMCLTDFLHAILHSNICNIFWRIQIIRAGIADPVIQRVIDILRITFLYHQHCNLHSPQMSAQMRAGLKFFECHGKPYLIHFMNNRFRISIAVSVIENGIQAVLYTVIKQSNYMDFLLLAKCIVCRREFTSRNHFNPLRNLPLS